MSLSARIADGILNSKPAVYLTKPNAASTAATIALISNLSKDGVNCYYYVTQSLNNKKIPEEKRKFVAALDLANGLLNIVFQPLIAIPIAKFSNYIFEKHIVPKAFSAKAVEKMYNILKPKKSLEDFAERYARNRSFAKVGLGVISTLVGAQIIAKRILVPLIATPVASMIKQKAALKEQAKTGETVKTNNSSEKLPASSTPNCFKTFHKA